MKNIGFYIVRTFSTILTILLLVVCLFFGYLYYCNIVKMDVPTLGSYSIRMVLSPSMAPKINVNDAVIIQKADPEKLMPGDIINFLAFESETNFTHRITSKEYTANGYEFKTKGDANNVEDTFVTSQDRILGKYVMRIPKLGNFLDLTSQKPYVIVILVILIMLLQFLCGVAERKFGSNRNQKNILPEMTEEIRKTEESVVVDDLDTKSGQHIEAVQQEQPQVSQVEGLFLEKVENEKGSTGYETDKN